MISSLLSTRPMKTPSRNRGSMSILARCLSLAWPRRSMYKDTLAKLLEANDRKSAAMTAGKKSSGGKNSHSGFKKKSERDGGSHKLESVTESGLEDGDSTTTTKDTVAGGGTKADRNSRSRSSSSKTSSSKADKAAKDLALTRDLPWCGCWGNGCL